MLKRLWKKLKSRTGASITVALLLFLVCAAVGSVVLTAGTAASGRISRLAESDQRYYSVTSAAELLRDVLDGQSVTIRLPIEETKTRSIERTYTLQNGVMSAGEFGATPTWESITAGFRHTGTGTEVTESSDLLTRLAWDIATGGISAGDLANSMDEAWTHTMTADLQEQSETLTLVPVLSDISSDPLKVTAEFRMDKSGKLTCVLYNETGTSNEKFKVKISLNVQKTESYSETVTSSDVAIDTANPIVTKDPDTDEVIKTEYTGTYAETRTRYKTVTVTWKATGITYADETSS